MKRLLLTLSSILAAALCSAAELPRIMMNTWYTTPFVSTACSATVASGGNVQNAINAATCGQTICLEAGATFTGNFTLPDNSCSDTSWIVIRTASPDTVLPQGRRVSPSQASQMAKLTAGSGSVVATNSGADHYRLIGLEVTPSAFISSIINLDGAGNVNADHFIIDRCYVHGDATLGSRRGINGNSSYVAVIDSYFSDLKEVGGDASAFSAWCGPGPYKLYNNFFEGAGENVLFGGSGCDPVGLLPRDIEIRRNTFSKPVGWASGPWQGKNLFELKVGERVLIENNLFEHMWSTMPGAQAAAIAFKASDDNACCQWIVTNDVTFRNNLIRHVHGGLKWSGFDGTSPSGTATTRYAVNDNLFYDVGSSWDAAWAGSEYGSGIYDGHVGPSSYSFNTHIITSGGAASKCGTGSSATNLNYDYNIFTATTYGIQGDSMAFGKVSIATCFPDTTFTSNVLAGQDCATRYDTYPTTSCPATDAGIGFVNLAGGNYRLDSSSAYDQVGPGGRDLGAFVPAAGESWLDLEVQQFGTSALLRFGRANLANTASCTYRYGASSGTSNSGGARRTLVLTGLTNAQQYVFSIDCGDQDGAIDQRLYTAATPAGGNRTVRLSLKPAAILSTAAHVTVDYGTTTSVVDGSASNASCGSGCNVDLSLPAGPKFYRITWKTAADAVLAVSVPEPIPVV